ncbi:hypothetical protein ABZP36_017151 [Zizania latifolia]
MVSKLAQVTSCTSSAKSSAEASTPTWKRNQAWPALLNPAEAHVHHRNRRLGIRLARQHPRVAYYRHYRADTCADPKRRIRQRLGRRRRRRGGGGWGRRIRGRRGHRSGISGGTTAGLGAEAKGSALGGEEEMDARCSISSPMPPGCWCLQARRRKSA